MEKLRRNQPLRLPYLHPAKFDWLRFVFFILKERNMILRIKCSYLWRRRSCWWRRCNGFCLRGANVLAGRSLAKLEEVAKKIAEADIAEIAEADAPIKNQQKHTLARLKNRELIFL
jgi:hypothetical protein